VTATVGKTIAGSDLKSEEAILTDWTEGATTPATIGHLTRETPNASAMATARTAKDSAAGTMTEEGSPKVTLTVGGTSIATKTDFRFLWKRPAEQLAGLTQLGSVAKKYFDHIL
jgi:hypothetical protein